ncbi:uncharacterized protein BDV17DRAFT_251429 [Aspergillus undulatus]|uniref:uncharacterized protein n=1 Tax=Aspergillus undulatus TaxID=1810928 RepID=UPI003CCDDC42
MGDGRRPSPSPGVTDPRPRGSSVPLFRAMKGAAGMQKWRTKFKLNAGIQGVISAGTTPGRGLPM